MDFFDNAVITNCQHAFCRKCIENYIGSKRIQSCPLCKNSINLRSLKQFSSLDPYILKTKNLEEQFNKEMNAIQAKEKTENLINSTKVESPSEKILEVPLENECEKNSSKSSSDFSIQVLRSRQKKRIISSEESVPCPKKVKPSQNGLCATNSVITSTRQENNMIETSVDNDQLNKSLNLNLNETIKIPVTKKVTEWLENNRPGTSKDLNKDIQTKCIVKSSISISRIENKENENLDNDTKNITKSLGILDGSIGELSTNPNDFNKKDIVINEADINTTYTYIKKPDINLYDMSKIDFVEKLKLRFPSKSYFCKELHIKKFNPLKFTNKNQHLSINKNSNYSIRHKSDSNLCLTTNTTPKLIRSNVIQTPKSAGSNFYHHPLPQIDLSPTIKEAQKQNESTKKTVRFLKSKNCPKRTQSDSDLSQKNQTTTLSCLNCAKKLKSTNTIGTNTESKKETRDQAAQYNIDDLIDVFLIDFAKLEAFLVKKIYLLLESEILDEILNEYFDSLAQTSVQSIPDSPPNQSTVILDTLTVNTEAIAETKDTQTPLSNEIINRRSSAFLSNFTELLSSSNSRKNNRTKRIPALEFTTNDRINLNESYLKDNEKDKNLTLIEDTYVNQADQSLVVEETPVKMDNRLVDEEIRHINETLSKSASRLQAIVNCPSRNRTFSIEKNDNTILYENEIENEKIMVITDTVQIQSDLVQKSFIKDESLPIEENAEQKNSNDNFKEPQMTKAAKSDFDNHSYFLNSLNLTNYNQNQILLSNETQNSSQKNIPLAKDILGVSLANESMADQSSFNLNQSSMPKITDSASTQSNSLKKKKSCETQLLTDSACQIIENICKDHYSVQNETICEEPARRIALSNITNKSKSQIEFVYSLLPSEMKYVINNYAQANGINISNEITESTTHLIVDADKNLLCGVTNKYLKAISRKIWIVSVAWILNCINTTQMIKPDKFEIRGDKSFGVHNGPLKSRTSEKYLMEFHEFLFIGEFLSTDSVGLDDLTQLVNLNGGVVKRKAKEFSVEDATKFKIVIFDDKFKKISKKIAETLKQNNIDCVNKSWLIDSLACYKLMSFQEYQTYDK